MFFNFQRNTDQMKIRGIKVEQNDDENEAEKENQVPLRKRKRSNAKASNSPPKKRGRPSKAAKDEKPVEKSRIPQLVKLEASETPNAQNKAFVVDVTNDGREVVRPRGALTVQPVSARPSTIPRAVSVQNASTRPSAASGVVTVRPVSTRLTVQAVPTRVLVAPKAVPVQVTHVQATKMTHGAVTGQPSGVGTVRGAATGAVPVQTATGGAVAGVAAPNGGMWQPWSNGPVTPILIIPQASTSSRVQIPRLVRDIRPVPSNVHIQVASAATAAAAEPTTVVSSEELLAEAEPTTVASTDELPTWRTANEESVQVLPPEDGRGSGSPIPDWMLKAAQQRSNKKSKSS